MRLWDVRRPGGTGGVGHQPWPPATAPALAGLLHSFGGFRHGVVGCVVHLGTVLTHSRGKVALTSLTPPFAAEVQPSMRPVSAWRVFEGAHRRPGGAAVQPHAVGRLRAEDGTVKVCT